METHNSEIHHDLYQQAQEQTLGWVWDDTTTKLPTLYHRQITALQREGVPAITTYSKIQLDRCLGKI